jgi:Zn-dependent M28 family amino/carboxypeptidase
MIHQRLAATSASTERSMFPKRTFAFSSLPAAALAVVIAAFSACAPADSGDPGVVVTPPPDDAVHAALETISEEELVQHVQVLASDEYGGRAPSSQGEDLTMQYLTERFAAAGLEPGGDHGTWLQEVPLVSITADPDMRLTISGNGAESTFQYGPDFIAWTTRVVDAIALDHSELVFVGYGTVAPEFGWDDYAGVDVAGKTLVMLVNDPGFATQDPELFKGNAMTYYGRWTYKYEEAARQGASGVLLIHETEPASYGWATVENSWSGPQFDLVAPDDNMSRIKVESWISTETAQAIFQQAGLDFEELKAQAATRDFQATSMGGLTASTSISNTVERSASHNFLAKIPGTTRPEEVVIYMGHWDHFGTDPGLEGDQIFNGAVDNASGIAALLELGEAFMALDPGPERTVVFMGTTAEEQGLLGSGYYGENPVYPLENTAGAINIDALNIHGPMNDFVIVGYGNSEMDDYAVRAAELQGRVVKPNPNPAAGSFYRSDHFPLAKQGVPALYGHAGRDHKEHGEEWTKERSDAWTAAHYHQPSDEYDPDYWNLAGAMEDLQLWFHVGLELAYSTDFPDWNEGTEFKAARDAMMER